NHFPEEGSATYIYIYILIKPSPPLPPFHPSIGQQNQFPFPVQNQAPIFPQPFGFDANNNLNNNFHDNNNVNPKPWYMSGDDQNWQQTWENTPIKVGEED
ncbi:hypothetical protein NECAME_01856, partial [Necator americanus]